MRNAFDLILDRNSEEEAVQKFIERNPLILHPFSSLRIFYKSPILTKYKTDIVILNAKKELLLIELERPGLKLMKKDSGVSASLQHAFDQVRNWLHEADDHRAAVLKCIDEDLDDVTVIRGVVIAGRDNGYEPEHLRKLKRTDFGRISFMTYDDLLRNLSSLIETVSAT